MVKGNPRQVDKWGSTRTGHVSESTGGTNNEAQLSGEKARSDSVSSLFVLKPYVEYIIYY